MHVAEAPLRVLLMRPRQHCYMQTLQKSKRICMSEGVVGPHKHMLFLLHTSRQLLWTPLTPPQTLSGWRLVERSELHSDLSCIIVA